MSCRQCAGIEQEFDYKTARRDLRKYHRSGPRKTTRILIDAVRKGSDGKTLLDIGGGVGVIQFELLDAGVHQATGVDAASAYLQVAREEAERRGVADRVAHHYGDIVEVAPQVDPADIVTLDRVICCYPDLDALIDATATRARTWYALVYPRDDRWMEPLRAAINLVFRFRRSPMRFFLHPAERVDAAVRRHELTLKMYRKTLLWQVAVYGREEVPISRTSTVSA